MTWRYVDVLGRQGWGVSPVYQSSCIFQVYEGSVWSGPNYTKCHHTHSYLRKMPWILANTSSVSSTTRLGCTDCRFKGTLWLKRLMERLREAKHCDSPNHFYRVEMVGLSRHMMSLFRCYSHAIAWSSFSCTVSALRIGVVELQRFPVQYRPSKWGGRTVFLLFPQSADEILPGHLDLIARLPRRAFAGRVANSLWIRKH